MADDASVSSTAVMVAAAAAAAVAPTTTAAAAASPEVEAVGPWAPFSPSKALLSWPSKRSAYLGGSLGRES